MESVATCEFGAFKFTSRHTREHPQNEREPESVDTRESAMDNKSVNTRESINNTSVNTRKSAMETVATRESIHDTSVMESVATRESIHKSVNFGRHPHEQA